MERTYLIQRLLDPYEDNGNENLKKLANAFAFGGGIVNGGLKKEAMELISEVFRFDYMGAAEFEWGAVPEALSGIYNRAMKKKLTTFIIDDQVYVICAKKDKEEVEDRIKYLMQQEPGWGCNEPKIRTKEAVKLMQRLEELNDEDSYVKNLNGWLELDNGYMFFTDKNMFEKTKALFDLE